MPDRRLRLFISHRSHVPKSRARLEALVKALEAEPESDDQADAVDVLYDKSQIESGTRWRDEIEAMLGECDAAAILVTQEALDSAWVLTESILLRARYDSEYDKHGRQPRFVLLPVVWEAVDREQLEKHPLWHPIDLDEIQFLEASDPAAVAAGLRKRLAALAPQLRPTPLDLIADDIARRLSDSAGTMRLDAVVQNLGVDVPLRVTGRSERLAYAIARWTIAQPPPSLKTVAEALTFLGNDFDASDANHILDSVAPLWVEIDAAAWLLRAVWQRPECRDVALVCRHPKPTLQHYVTRAHLPWRKPELLLLNGVTGGRHDKDVAAELRTEARARFARWRELEDDDLDERLAHVAARLFVGLPLPEDDAIVATIQAKYPALTFVFFVRGDEAAGAAVQRRLKGVEWIVPAHDPGLEADVLADHDAAYLRFGL